MMKPLKPVTASRGLKKLLTGAALLMAFLCQSQSLQFKYTSNVKTPIKSDNAFMNALVMAINNDVVYFTTKKPTDGEKKILVYSFNLKKNSYDSLVIPKNKLNKGFFGERRLSMCVTDKEIIIVTDENIFIFKNSNKSPDLLKIVKNTKYYHHIYKLGKDDYMLYINYDFHPMDATDKHVWAKLDVEKGEIIQQQKMPDDNVLFSFYVNNWISTYKGLIAYAHTSDYKITFYDSNFNAIDSLSSPKLDSNRRHIEKLEKLDNLSKDGIYEIQLLEDSLLTRIQKVFLLDSTHLLVMLKLPKQHYLYETWAKENGHWELKKSITLSEWYEPNKAYTKSDPPFSSLIGNVDGILYLGKNKFFSIYYPYQEYIDTKAFNKKTDVENPINELVKKGDTYFGIREFIIYE